MVVVGEGGGGGGGVPWWRNSVNTKPLSHQDDG